MRIAWRPRPPSSRRGGSRYEDRSRHRGGRLRGHERRPPAAVRRPPGAHPRQPLARRRGSEPRTGFRGSTAQGLEVEIADRQHTWTRRRKRCAGPTPSSTWRRRSRSPRASWSPLHDARVNVIGTLNLLEAARAQSRPPISSSPPPTRSTARSPDLPLAVDGEPLPPDRPAARGARGRRATPAALLHALRVLEGSGRPVRRSTMPTIRSPLGGVPDELHLRTPSAGHRGPGLGGALPHSRHPGAADHDLRGRQAGSRHPLRRRSHRRHAPGLRASG